MVRIPGPLRRLLRPLAPWRLRGLVQNHRLARQVRVNIDVVVPSLLEARRWRATMPRTFRAGRWSPAEVGDDALFIPPGDPHGLGRFVSAASPVVVAAHSRPPSWAKRGTLPQVEPIALAVLPEAIADIDGSVTDPVPALFDRFVQAGHRLTVVPGGRRPQGRLRLDPIPGPVAVVLNGVPLHDVGGGSRGAQLAMELLARGYHVAFVTRFGAWSSGDLGLRHIHPRLEQYTVRTFDADSFIKRCRSADRLAVCEIPVAEYASLAGRLAEGGFDVVYDLIDEWSDPALGLDWYKPSTEEQLVALADGIVASATPLVSRLGRTDVALVPNGVNDLMFSGDAGPPPGDLPAGSPILGYHGSLYGDWFDWGALAEVAAAFPEAAVTVIGDARQHPPLPPNVHFLGVKAQFQLPGYVGRYAVGLVPFTVTPTTHAVSPLKAFECLAMGVPVAAPPLHALEGLDGVFVHDSLVAAVRAALAGPRPDAATARRDHGWGDRLERVLATVGRPLPQRLGPIPRLELRPVQVYPFKDRLLR